MDFLLRPIVLPRVKHGNQMKEQAEFLFATHKAEIDPRYHTVIKDRLLHADELKFGLPGKDSDKFCQRHIEQSKMYCDSIEETLRIIESLLPPPAPGPR